MRREGGSEFHAIHAATWREDWPDKRGPWIEKIRGMVEDATKQGGRAIVIPARTIGEGPEKKFLSGLEYDLGSGFSTIKGIQEKRANADLQLPLWGDAKRGTPNSFLRSALFAAVQSKDRIWFERAILASQDGITIKYTGRQLNQEDLSVWETLVHHARPHALGCILEFSASQLLKSLGLPTGGAQHDMLNATIDRLTACSVSINHEGKGYGGSLIEAWENDEKTGHYKVRVNRELAKLFGDSQWTGINWDQRKLLRKMPLAQYLHAHYSSHKNPFPYKVETLYAYSGSQNKSLRGFKQKLVKALHELVSIKFLENFYIDHNNIVHVKKHGFRDTL